MGCLGTPHEIHTHTRDPIPEPWSRKRIYKSQLLLFELRLVSSQLVMDSKNGGKCLKVSRNILWIVLLLVCT